MRKGWRGVGLIRMAVLVGTVAPVRAAPGDPRPMPVPQAVIPADAPAGGPAVRMTVEVDWSAPAAVGPVAVELGMGEGRILGASRLAPTPQALDAPVGIGRWAVATSRSGRVRARVEAPLGATLTVQAGAQSVRIPLARLLDGPQRTVPPATIDVGAARVAWDAIEVDPGDFAGAAAPGARVPVRLGLNVLTSDASEVDLRFTAELKSVATGGVAWQHEQRAVVASDALEPTAWMLNVPAPPTEGLYALEVRAAWEPAPADGSRIGRLLRRRKPAASASGTATRRVTLAVVDPKAKPAAAAKPARGAAEESVDAIDLARPRGHRPSASGRAPGSGASWRIPDSAVVEETRRDRLRGWIGRGDGEPVVLPPADASGLAWSAVGLKVPHPGRPHRLTVAVVGGHPSALGVGLVAPGGAKGKARVVLDACASGPPLIEGAGPSTFSWLVWPEAAEPVLVLVNRNASSAVRLGAVGLAELADVPPGPAIVAPIDGGRTLGIDLTAPSALDRFGGAGDPLVAGRHLAKYLDYCGATAVVLPDALADRGRRQALDRQAEEDPVGPDRLDLLLTALDRHGLAAWVDVAMDGALPGLPGPDSEAARARGLVRIDGAGKADGPAYHPLHAEVRGAMARLVVAPAGLRRSHPSVAGVLVRLGPGSTLLGRPDSGLDDATFARFVAAKFDPALARAIPGLDAMDDGRFAARARFLDGDGQKPWLAWRAAELAGVYTELAEAVAGAAPGARLVVATPDLDSGTVGEEVRRLDRVGLGPSQAWRSVGLDLAAWPSGEADAAPIVLRGVGLSPEEFARDLAVSPELDAQVASRPGRGIWLGASGRSEPAPEPTLAAPALPDASAVDEPLGHALAALDGRWFFASLEAVAGREERVRRLAQAVRSLPAPARGPAEPRPPSGVAARLVRSGDGAATYLALANDTPYPIQVEAVVRCPSGTGFADLARTAPLNAEPVAGGLRVVADLPPFGVTSARIDAEATLDSVAPHPGAAVLDGMKAQSEDLALTLARLNRSAVAASDAGPANADFEAPAVQLASARSTPGVAGWAAVGETTAAIATDPESPHGGRASLRLDAPALPASAASEPFAPAVHPSLTIHAWLRSERPEARVRLWLEGQAEGKPFARQLVVDAKPEWSSVAARVSGIPEGGLESARLRFEAMTPGRFWLDDIAITGPTLGEPERLNARRDLMAALSAYRDRRYADFARLAGSHWARRVAPEPAAGRLADRSAARPGDAPASALPPARRLR